MFESLEDLVETSVDLNHRGIPFLTALAKMVTTVEPKPEPFTSELGIYLKEVIDFMTKIETMASEEGEVITNDLEERKIH